MAPPGRLVQRVAQRLKAQAACLASHHSTCSASRRIATGPVQLRRLSPIAAATPPVVSGTSCFLERANADGHPGAIARAEPVATADALPVVITVAGVAAIGAYVLHLFGNMDAPLEINARLKAEDFAYVCEGEGSVLCSYVGKDPEWRGCLLQLVKEAPEGASQDDALSALRLRAELAHLLASHCFQSQFVDRPQLVSLPEEDIRQLDAQIFTGRPAGRRNQRLLSKVAATAGRGDESGRMVALRFQNVFEGPPAMAASMFGSMFGEKPVQLLQAPMLTIDLRPGCGLQEVEGLPSRDILRACAASGQAAKRILAADPVGLFSGDAAKAAAVLRTRLEVLPADDAFRMYIDGKPLYPTGLQEAGSDKTPIDAVLKYSQQEGCLPSTTNDLLTALGCVLTTSGPAATDRGVLSDLRLLQCFAAGEQVEKMAERLWEDLQKHSGPKASASLKSSESIVAAVSGASRKRAEKDRLANQERQGRKLMAVRELNKRQEAMVRDWLSSFLLGRAAFDAHLLVSFIHVNAKVASDANMQSYLRDHRFLPLKDIVPGKDWSVNVWFRVTVVGMGSREPSEIPKIALELEESVNRYREMSASV